MDVVISVSLIALIFSILGSLRILRYGLAIGFILITFLGCVHFNYGNDYPNYFQIYYDVISQPFSLGALLSGELYKEPLWALFCLLFEPLGGFFTMVAVLNIFQNLWVYKMIVNHVPRQWIPVSFFIYLFSNSLYLLNFSMMRQGFVVCAFFVIWPWIINKRIIKAFIAICACVLVHSSAFVLLPLIFWGYYSFDIGRLFAKRLIWAYICSLLISLAFKKILAAFSFIPILTLYLDNYGSDDSTVTYGLGYLIDQIPFILSLLFLTSKQKWITNQHRAIVAFSSLGYILLPLAVSLPLLTRVCLYFVIFQLIAVPLVYKQIKNVKLRVFLLLIFFLYTWYKYILFFMDPTWSDMYSEFQTIFQVL